MKKVDPKYTDFIHIIRKLKIPITSYIYTIYVKYFAGVDLDSGARFVGFPTILMRDGAKISIGKNLSATSKSYINPAGVYHEVIISALGKKARVVIGDNVGLSGTSINCRSTINIGDNVLVGAGTAIWDTDFHPLDHEQRLVDMNAGKTLPIEIEKNVFIGARVIILKGVTIGQGAVIAAGTVVSKDVPRNHIAFGNPMGLRAK